MPANPKHLTTSGGQRFAKISAAVLGGYLISALLHMCLAIWIPMHKEILITSLLTLYVVWCVFSLIPFLFKNGWKAWLIYLSMIVVLSVIYYFGSLRENPFIQ